MRSGDDGRLTRIEAFDVAREGAALARFEELRRYG